MLAKGPKLYALPQVFLDLNAFKFEKMIQVQAPRPFTFRLSFPKPEKKAVSYRTAQPSETQLLSTGVSKWQSRTHFNAFRVELHMLLLMFFASLVHVATAALWFGHSD